MDSYILLCSCQLSFDMYCLGSRFKLVDFLILFLFLPGKGPHVLGSTGLDINLLPNTYVTLQSVPLKRSNFVVQWETRPRSKQHLLGQNVKRKDITIGPMNEQLNHLFVFYIYKYSERSQHAFHTSRGAMLHLFG